jgi:hypothetical protein
MLPGRPLDMAGARAVAEAQALRLLQLFDIRGPAVDVGLLTTLPRISVEVGPDLQGRYLSGESGWDRGRWLIRISRKDSLTRRRFTLAHEFKHILDGPAEKHVYGKLGVGDEDDRGRCIEEIADYFAASFLMPRTCDPSRYSGRSPAGGHIRGFAGRHEPSIAGSGTAHRAARRLTRLCAQVVPSDAYSTPGQTGRVSAAYTGERPDSISAWRRRPSS